MEFQLNTVQLSGNLFMFVWDSNRSVNENKKNKYFKYLTENR